MTRMVFLGVFCEHQIPHWTVAYWTAPTERQTNQRGLMLLRPAAGLTRIPNYNPSCKMDGLTGAVSRTVKKRQIANLGQSMAIDRRQL